MAKKAKVWSGTEWVDLAAATTDLSQYPNMTTTPISGFRNAIINGGFDINQRGFTSVTTVGTFGFDRWRLGTGGNGTTTYTPVNFTPGNAISGYEPVSHARLVTTGQSTSAVNSILVQPIENVRTFAGQTITISFWAKAASGTPKVAIELDQQFGTGGSTRVTTYAGQATISTSWARYSVTVTVPSISGKTIGAENYLGVFLWTSAGTDFNARTGSLGIQSNTFDFWGVQVEQGSIATPFEQRPIGTELSLCQRYFYRFSDGGYVTNYAGGTVESADAAAFAGGSFPVTMRRIPDLSFGANFKFYSPATLTRTPVINQNRCSTTHFSVNVTFGGGGTVGQAWSLYNGTGGNAFLDYSSEL
jgi:hypothetical protein